MNIQNRIKKCGFGVCAIMGLALLPMVGSMASHHAATGINLQALPIDCVEGFRKGAYKKAPNGMVTKMVCKTPVLSCPENTAPGIVTLTEPKVKNLGGGDSDVKFRFVYTCKYYKVEG